MQSWFFWIGQSSCERRSTQCAESQVCGSLEAGVPFGTAGSDEGGAEFTPGTEGGAGGIAEGTAGLLRYRLVRGLGSAKSANFTIFLKI